MDFFKKKLRVNERTRFELPPERLFAQEGPTFFLDFLMCLSLVSGCHCLSECFLKVVLILRIKRVLCDVIEFKLDLIVS